MTTSLRIPLGLSHSGTEVCCLEPVRSLTVSPSLISVRSVPLYSVPSFFLPVGETIVSLSKSALIPGGSDSLVYTTLSGSVGMVVPFTSMEDHDFFQHLEMHLRGENPPLCGRDHLSYRSSYYPIKNVIDGDLCEQFNTLDPNKQKSIAEELDRTPAEVSKKLEDIRTRYAF